MSHQVPWGKVILEEFISQAQLTDLEERVMRTRVAGWSRVKQADTFGISLSTLDRIIKLLKLKYDHAQKYSAILPPRRYSAQEAWMDDN